MNLVVVSGVGTTAAALAKPADVEPVVVVVVGGGGGGVAAVGFQQKIRH